MSKIGKSKRLSKPDKFKLALSLAQLRPSLYNIYISFHIQVSPRHDFSQLPLWNSQEPAEHLGLPGVAALEHDGAELHHSLLLDMEDIVHPVHQGWR